MRINYKDKLTLEESYEPYADNIKGEFNRISAKNMNKLFKGLKYSLTQANWRPNFWSKYTDDSKDKVAIWRMFLTAEIPYSEMEEISISFGEYNQYDDDEFHDEYYHDYGVMICDRSFDAEAFLLSYELFVSYAVLIRNSYELQLIAEGKDKIEVSKVIRQIDQLIYEYCDRYKIEIAEDFTVFYSNFKHHILRLVMPGREYDNIEIPESVEVLLSRQGVAETLPLGSVVTLKTKEGGATNYGLVIIDRFIISQDNPHLYYSYKGVLYPIGSSGESKGVLFAHYQIDKILHKGYGGEHNQEYVKKVIMTFHESGIEQVGTRLHKPMNG